MKRKAAEGYVASPCREEEGLLLQDVRVPSGELVTVWWERSEDNRPGAHDWQPVEMTLDVRAQRPQHLDVEAILQAATAFAENHPGPGFVESVRPSERQRPGRAGHPATYWARIARDYTQRLDARDPRPTQSLAIAHGVSQNTATNWIKTCRQKGLLTAAPPGKAGGALTAAARRLIRELPEGDQ